MPNRARSHQPTARDTERPIRRGRLRWVAGARRGAVGGDIAMCGEVASRRTAVSLAGRPVAHRAQGLRDRAVLRGGPDVLIRGVRHDDAALLVDGFDRLSGVGNAAVTCPNARIIAGYGAPVGRRRHCAPPSRTGRCGLGPAGPVGEVPPAGPDRRRGCGRRRRRRGWSPSFETVLGLIKSTPGV